MIESNPNEPTFVFDSLPLHWQMTRCEKFAFASLLAHAKPEVAIEIGTYKGGSLQLVAQSAGKVYSLDINHESQAALKPRFTNVEFLAGDSRKILPSLVDALNSASAPVGFVLIDGDHTTDGVRTDINSVLKIKPVRPVYIVFHDSFHPPCRQGILAANWQECPFVHYVEIDFIPGVFHREAFDTAQAGSMYGGLAVALLLPEERKTPLRIHESQKGLFETVYAQSCHRPGRGRTIAGILSRIRRRLFG